MDLEGIGNLVNLELLQLFMFSFSWGSHQIKLPESLGLLRKLRVLEIHESELTELPQCIGDLVELRRITIETRLLQKLPESFCKLTNLEELILQKCDYLEELPQDFGNLTGLRFLFLDNSSTFMHYLPLSFTKLIPICTTNVHHLATHPDSIHGAVGWLKDFNDLKGVLMINNINQITSLADAQNANFISKHKLEMLSLDWYEKEYSDDPLRTGLPEEYTVQKGILSISIDSSENYKSLDGLDFEILYNFQPHQHLKHLYIDSYSGSVFPGWMGDLFRVLHWLNSASEIALTLVTSL